MFNWKTKYFKKKVRGVEKMILDLEFKRAKTLMIREGIRQEYDNLCAKMASLDETIKREEKEKKMEAGDIARLGDDKIRLQGDIDKLIGQMEGLDIEVSGCKPSKDYPEGYNGINQQLDALHELIGMLKDYIKTL